MTDEDLVTVAKLFERYRATVTTEVSAEAVRASERAFYGGAAAILATCLFFVGRADIPEDVGVRLLQALMDETDAYVRRVTAPQSPDAVYTAPDPDDIKAILLALSDEARGAIPAGWGFMLMIFSFGPGGSMFYASNADRADILQTLREFAKRQTQ